MTYSWKDEGKKIRIEGLLTTDTTHEIEVKDVVSYLNELEKTHGKLKEHLKSLLKASLDGRNQNMIQNEIAVILGYSSGIEEFVRENYGSLNRY